MEIVLHEAATNTPCVTCGRSEDVVKVPVNENVNGDFKEEDRGFSRLPQKDPIDITFENITYTASLGFRKGKVEILTAVVFHVKNNLFGFVDITRMFSIIFYN